MIGKIWNLGNTSKEYSVHTTKYVVIDHSGSETDNHKFDYFFSSAFNTKDP